MPTALVALIGLAAFVGMIVCSKKKDNPKSKPLAGLFLVILIVCAGMYLSNNGIFGEDKTTRDQRSSYSRFEESCAKTLGEYIAKNFASQKVMIVAPGGTEFDKNPSQSRRTNLVKKYLPNAEVKGLGYTRNPNDAAMMPGASAKEFNDFFKQNTDVAVFVLLEDLPYSPMEAAKLTIWKNKGKQKIALLNGDVSMLYPYFKQDIVTAAVVSKPGLKEADYEKLASKNLDEAFKMRYLLITSKNVDQHKTNKRIFRQN